jgi:hypothetical protein
MNQTTLVSGGVHGWNAAGLVRVCRALTVPLYRGPMGVSSLMNDIELACLLLPRGKG